MRISLNIYTPSTYLSNKTFNWIIGDITGIIEKGVIDGLKECNPDASMQKLKERVNKSIEFNLIDLEKGSMTVMFVGAIFGIIGKVLYDLGIDIAKSNPKYIELKNSINEKYAPIITDRVSKRLNARSKFGPLPIKELEISSKKLKNNEIQTNIFIFFDVKKSGTPKLGLEEQLEQALQEIKFEKEKNNRKSKRKKRKKRK